LDKISDPKINERPPPRDTSSKRVSEMRANTIVQEFNTQQQLKNTVIEGKDKAGNFNYKTEANIRDRSFDSKIPRLAIPAINNNNIINENKNTIKSKPPINTSSIDSIGIDTDKLAKEYNRLKTKPISLFDLAKNSTIEVNKLFKEKYNTRFYEVLCVISATSDPNSSHTINGINETTTYDLKKIDGQTKLMNDCLGLTGYEVKDGKISKIPGGNSNAKILVGDSSKLIPKTEKSLPRITDSKPVTELDKINAEATKTKRFGKLMDGIDATFLVGEIGLTVLSIYKTAKVKGRDSAIIETAETIGQFIAWTVGLEIGEQLAGTALTYALNLYRGSAMVATASETLSAQAARSFATNVTFRSALRASIQSSVRGLMLRTAPGLLSQLIPNTVATLAINPVIAVAVNAAIVLTFAGLAIKDFIEENTAQELRDIYNLFLGQSNTRENDIQDNLETAEIQLQIAISNNLYVILQRNAVIPDGSNAYYITSNYVGILDIKINSYVFYYWKEISTNDMVSVVNNDNNKGIYIYSPTVRSTIFNYFLQNQYYTNEELIENTSLDKNDPNYNELIPSFEEYYRIQNMQQINGNDVGLDTIKFFYSTSSYLWSYVIYPPTNIKQSYYFPTSQDAIYGNKLTSPTLNYAYYFLNIPTQDTLLPALNTFYQTFKLLCGVTQTDVNVNPYTTLNMSLQNPYKLINLAKQLINCLPIISKFNFGNIDTIFLPAFIDFCNSVYSIFYVKTASNDKSIIGLFVTNAVYLSGKTTESTSGSVTTIKTTTSKGSIVTTKNKLANGSTATSTTVNTESAPNVTTSDSPSILKNVKYTVNCYTFNTKEQYDQLFLPITQFYKNMINDSRVSAYHYPISIESLLNYSYMFHFLGLNNLYNLGNNGSGITPPDTGYKKSHAMNVIAKKIYQTTTAQLTAAGIDPSSVPYGPDFFTSDMKNEIQNYINGTLVTDSSNVVYVRDKGGNIIDPCKKFSSLPSRTNIGLTSTTNPQNKFTSYSSLPLTSPMIDDFNIDENGMIFNLDSFSKIYDQILQVVQKSNFLGNDATASLSMGLSSKIINLINTIFIEKMKDLPESDYYAYFLQIMISVLKQTSGYDLSSGEFNDIINIMYGVNPFNISGSMIIQPFFTNFLTDYNKSQYYLSETVNSFGNIVKCFNNGGVTTPVVNAIIPIDDSNPVIDIPGSLNSINNGGMGYKTTNNVFLTNNFYNAWSAAFQSSFGIIGNKDDPWTDNYYASIALNTYYKTLYKYNSFLQNGNIIDYSKLAAEITKGGTNKLMNMQTILSVTNLFSSILLIMMFNDTGFAMNLLGFFGNVANYWNGIFDQNTKSNRSEKNYIYKYADVWFGSVLGMNPPSTTEPIVKTPKTENGVPKLQNILQSNLSTTDFSSSYFIASACGVDITKGINFNIIGSTITPSYTVTTTTNVTVNNIVKKQITVKSYSNINNKLIYSNIYDYNSDPSNEFIDPVSGKLVNTNIPDVNSTAQNSYIYDGDLITISLLTGVANNINGCIGFSIDNVTFMVTFYYFKSLPPQNNGSVYNNNNINQSIATQSLYTIKQDPDILFTCFSLFPVFDNNGVFINLFNNGATQQILLNNTINNFILTNNSNATFKPLSPSSNALYPFRSLRKNLPASLLYDKRINYSVSFNNGFSPTALINPRVNNVGVTSNQLTQIILFFNCNSPGNELSDYNNYQQNGYLTRIPNTPISPDEIAAYSRMAYINTFLEFFIHWVSIKAGSAGNIYTSRIQLVNKNITEPAVINFLSWFINVMYHGDGMYYPIQYYDGPYVNSIQGAIGQNNFMFSRFLTTGFSINPQSSTVTFYKISATGELLNGLYIKSSDNPVNVTEYASQLYLLSAISNLQTYKNSLVTSVFANIFTNASLYITTGNVPSSYYGGLLYNVYPVSINKYSVNDRHYPNYLGAGYASINNVQPDPTCITTVPTFNKNNVKTGDDNANVIYCMYIADTIAGLSPGIITGFLYNSSNPQNTTFYKCKNLITAVSPYTYTPMNVWANSTQVGVFYDRPFINTNYLPSKLSTQPVPPGQPNRASFNLTFTQMSNNYKIANTNGYLNGMLGYNPNVNTGIVKPIWSIVITANIDNLTNGNLLVIGSDFNFYTISIPQPYIYSSALIRPNIGTRYYSQLSINFINTFVAVAKINNLNIIQIIILPDTRYVAITSNYSCYIFNSIRQPIGTLVATNYQFPFHYNNFVYMSSTYNNTILALPVLPVRSTYPPITIGNQTAYTSTIINLTKNTAWDDYNSKLTTQQKLVQPNFPGSGKWIVIFTTDGEGNFLIGLNNTASNLDFNSYSTMFPNNYPSYQSCLISVPIKDYTNKGRTIYNYPQNLFETTPGVVNNKAPVLWYIEDPTFTTSDFSFSPDKFKQLNYIEPASGQPGTYSLIDNGIIYFGAKEYLERKWENYYYSFLEGRDIYEFLPENFIMTKVGTSFAFSSQDLRGIKYAWAPIKVPLANIQANPSTVIYQPVNPYSTALVPYSQPSIPGFTPNQSQIIFQMRQAFVNLNNSIINNSYFLTFFNQWSNLNKQYLEFLNCNKANVRVLTSNSNSNSCVKTNTDGTTTRFLNILNMYPTITNISTLFYSTDYINWSIVSYTNANFNNISLYFNNIIQISSSVTIGGITLLTGDYLAINVADNKLYYCKLLNVNTWLKIPDTNSFISITQTSTTLTTTTLTAILSDGTISWDGTVVSSGDVYSYNNGAWVKLLLNGPFIFVTSTTIGLVMIDSNYNLCLSSGKITTTGNFISIDQKTDNTFICVQTDNNVYTSSSTSITTNMTWVKVNNNFNFTNVIQVNDGNGYIGIGISNPSVIAKNYYQEPTDISNATIIGTKLLLNQNVTIPYNPSNVKYNNSSTSFQNKFNDGSQSMQTFPEYKFQMNNAEYIDEQNSIELGMSLFSNINAIFNTLKI
jgi:hypothetical protein